MAGRSIHGALAVKARRSPPALWREALEYVVVFHLVS
jgi:hypothetical protein